MHYERSPGVLQIGIDTAVFKATRREVSFVDIQGPPQYVQVSVHYDIVSQNTTDPPLTIENVSHFQIAY